MTKPTQFNEVLSPINYVNHEVFMLDQRLLPVEEVWRRYSSAVDVADAIKAMVVRGAPAIGCAAAMGIAVGALHAPKEPDRFHAEFDKICLVISSSRPTAVNLFWAVERQRQVFEKTFPSGVEETRAALEKEALQIWAEDIASCKEMGRIGADLIPDGATVLTHCNAGALATGGYGTALGVIRGAVAQGKRIQVFADETRPFLQGARLTAWELAHDKIDVTLICDNMAGTLMAQKQITCVIVGADRIARNGDTANKIGTYSVAVLAHHHGLPFYVAAPKSTIDLSMETGAHIPIEERNHREITHVGDNQVAPLAIKFRNPAFDVTPNHLISAIITEAGIARQPYIEQIPGLF